MQAQSAETWWHRNTLQSMLTPHTCSTACFTGASVYQLVVRAGAATHWKPSVSAKTIPYLFKQDGKPSKGQGHEESLHLCWHRTHLAANLFAHTPEQGECCHSVNAGCKNKCCTIVQHQLYANNQCLHTTAKVRFTRNTLIAKCSSHIVVNVLHILLQYLTHSTHACGCVLVFVSGPASVLQTGDTV